MNPEGRWTIQEVADTAHASAFHFHRVFSAVTGETVGAFVRRARLEHAASLLKANPRRTITSVAMGAGFASSAEFTREFTREYGTAPSRWDRRGRVDLRPKIHAPSRPLRKPEVTAEFHPECRIAYVRVRTWFRVPDLPRGYGRLTSALERIGFAWRSARLVGMSWDNYETTPLDLLTYDLGFVVPMDLPIAAGLGVLDLPDHDAVHLRCNGELRRIADAWDFLYEVWLPEHDREPGALPSMKWFHRRPDEVGWSRSVLDCAVPLESYGLP